MKDRRLNKDGSINLEELNRAYTKHYAKQDGEKEMRALLDKSLKVEVNHQRYRGLGSCEFGIIFWWGASGQRTLKLCRRDAWDTHITFHKFWL